MGGTIVLHRLAHNADFKSTWSGFLANANRNTLAVRDGLYLFFFANSLDEAILDNNKDRKKTVIHRRGASLKPGKFENGFLERLSNYQSHLHWVAADGSVDLVFARCFRRGFVLDLSNCDIGLPSAARVFERYWVDSIYQFTKGEGHWADSSVKQKLRSEWRYLNPEPWNASREKRFDEFLSKLAARIWEMAAVARERQHR
jgi:hypothetical protein